MPDAEKRLLLLGSDCGERTSLLQDPPSGWITDLCALVLRWLQVLLRGWLAARCCAVCPMTRPPCLS